MKSRVIQPGVTESFMYTLDAIERGLGKLGANVYKSDPYGISASIAYTDFSDDDLRKIGEFLNLENNGEYLVNAARSLVERAFEEVCGKERDCSLMSRSEMETEIKSRLKDGQSIEDCLPEGNFIIECGFGVMRDMGKFSTPEGLGIFIRAYDDESIRISQFNFDSENGTMQFSRFRTGDGYLLSDFQSTEFDCPEDVDFEDALSTCEYFLKKHFPKLDPNDILYGSNIIQPSPRQ